MLFATPSFTARPISRYIFSQEVAFYLPDVFFKFSGESNEKRKINARGIYTVAVTIVEQSQKQAPG